MTHIRMSTTKDVHHVSRYMRDADRKDIAASSDSLPQESLQRGLELSKPSCFSIIRDNYPTTAIESDIDYIAPRLREPDLQEIKALGDFSPKEALTVSYFGSKPSCYTAIGQGVPVAMFGVVPFEENERWGSIWLLGTNDITDEIPISFLKWTKRFFPILTEPYDMVCNIVDKRNEVHVKWIKWLGFSFIRELKHGPENRTFYEFARLNHV
jgi:hypothetical protein